MTCGSHHMPSTVSHPMATSNCMTLQALVYKKKSTEEGRHPLQSFIIKKSRNHMSRLRKSPNPGLPLLTSRINHPLCNGTQVGGWRIGTVTQERARRSEEILFVWHPRMTPCGSNLGRLPGNAKAYHWARGSFAQALVYVDINAKKMRCIAEKHLLR
jgi:hypothetical protein